VGLWSLLAATTSARGTAPGMPTADLLAWATILVELFGGLAVFLGLFIALAAIPMAILRSWRFSRSICRTHLHVPWPHSCGRAVLATCRWLAPSIWRARSRCQATATPSRPKVYPNIFQSNQTSTKWKQRQIRSPSFKVMVHCSVLDETPAETTPRRLSA